VRCLEEAGFATDVARDGIDGLWRAKEGRYDAITLDLMLPGKNGYLVCRELRDAGIWTPIVMLTAKDGDFDEAEGFEFGADDYIRKPFSPVVLVARLNRLIMRGETNRLELRIGDLVVQPRLHRVTCGGREIALTAREFAVLEALALRSPEVVAKSELLDLVWGMDFTGDPNIIEVYIGYLRRKIDTADRVPMIHTVRGVGYRIHVTGSDQ
jgi:two-component system, OmpR family, response regulator